MKQSPFRKILIITAAVLTVILAASCPQEVTAPMVAMVEDSLVPTITITSPSGGDNYYSTVTVSGILSDDVQVEGDAGGQISSLSYDIANDDFRKGKIEIGLDDQITADTEYGSGTIDYDIITGEFSFTFSTTSPSELRDLISLSITTVDRNNNTITEELNLYENDGPFVEFGFYNDDTSYENSAARVTYTDNDGIFISGTVADSEYLMTSADEIALLNWRLEGTAYSGTIDLSDNSSNLLESGTYSSLNTDGDNNFFYDPATRRFSTYTEVDLDSGSKIITITATDLFGHETEEQETLSPPATLSLSSIDANVPYFSTVQADNISISSKLSDPNDLILDEADVATVSYSFTDSSGSPLFTNSFVAYDSNAADGDYNEWYETSYGSDGDYEEININNTFSGADSFFDTSGNFTIDLKTSILLVSGASTNVIMKVIAEDLEGSEVSKKITLEIDNAPPVISGTSVTATGGNVQNSVTYLNTGDQITLDFLVEDSLAGITGLENITNVSIDDEDVTGTVSYNGGGSFSVNYTLTDANIADEAELNYSISTVDNVGNTSSTGTVTDSTLVYYHDYTGNEPGINWSSSNSSYPSWTRAADTITGTITGSRILSSNSTINIASLGAVGITSSAPYISTSPVLSGAGLAENSDISYSVYIEDAAGNSTSWTGDTLINYDGTPPVVVFSGSLLASPALKTGFSVTAVSTDTYYYTLTEGSGIDTYSWAGLTGCTTSSTDDTLTITDAIDDNYTIALRVTDNAGNQSSSASFDFSWDAVGPVITPAPLTTTGGVEQGGKTYLETGDTIRLYFDVTDSPSGLDEITLVEINGTDYTGSIVDDTGGNYHVSVTLNDGNTADGTDFSYRISAVDNAGNGSNTGTVTDTDIIYYHEYGAGSYPALSWESSNSSYPSWTRATDTIEGTITSTRVLSPSSTITIGSLSAVGISGSGPYTATSAALSGAGYNDGDSIGYSVYVQDAAGNFTTLANDTGIDYDGSIPTVDFSDSLAGTPNITAAFDVTTNSSDAYYYTPDATGSSIVEWDWTVPPALTHGGITGSTLSITDGAPGNYSISLVTTDSAGNSSSSESFDFTWDITGPDIDNIAWSTTGEVEQGGKSYLETGDTIRLDFDVTDSPSGLDEITLVEINGTDYTGSIVDDTGGNYHVSVTLNDGNTADGTDFSYRISAVDNAGNGSNTGTVTDTDIIYYHEYGAGSYPALSWESSNSSYPSWTRAADTIEGTITSTRVLSPSSTITIGSLSAVGISGSGPYTATSAALSGAGYNDGDSIGYSVYVQDAAGNFTTLASDTGIDYDGTDPVFSFTGFSGTPMISDPFDVTINTSDAYYYELTEDGTAHASCDYDWTLPSGFSATSGTSSQTLTGIDGDAGTNYTISLEVTDSAGNNSSESFTFDYDNTPPATPSTIDSTAGDGYINNDEYTAGNTTVNVGYGNMDATDSIRLYHNSSVYATTLYESDKSIAFVIDNADLIATNVFSAVSVDSVGNESSSISLTLILDTDVPTFDNIPDSYGSYSDHFEVVPSNLDGTGSPINVASYKWVISGQGSATFEGSDYDTLRVGPSGTEGTDDLELSDTIDGGDDGTYNVSFTVEDSAGNISGADTFSFTWTGDGNGKSISNLSQNTSSGGSSSSTSISSAASINTYNFDTPQSETSSPSERGATQYNTVSSAQASESPSARYSGDLYRLAVLTTRGIAETATTTQETSAQTELDKTSAASLEETKINNETEWDENYINTEGSPKVSLDTSYQSVERRTAVSGNINKLSSKASAAVTGRQTVKPPPVEINEETKKSSALPAAIILLLGGSAAGIIIRKRRI